MPIVSDVSGLTPESHKEIEVVCDLGVSEKCRKRWRAHYRDIRKTLARNNDRVVCLYCSRMYKNTGRNNPNCKYKTFDDHYFSNIDTDFKSYLLGWIASDGSINKNHSITIEIHKKDISILKWLKDNLCCELPIKNNGDSMIYFSFHSKIASKDICNLLEISPGKKSGAGCSNLSNFPNLSSDQLRWAFIRGLFDGDGSVSDPKENKKRYPIASISSTSDKLLRRIREFTKIPCSISGDSIEWSGTNALDFMGKIYEEAPFALQRKLFLYHIWCHWVPSLSGSGTHGETPYFRWNKSRKDAVPPYKEIVSDSGYDLTLIDIKKTIGNVVLYNTGIKINPPFGYYFDLVPRSSIIKTGYILANSIGILDRSYIGEILVPLVKIDPNFPDLPLPARIVQIIPRKIAHLEAVQVETIEETARGGGGFGSTGK